MASATYETSVSLPADVHAPGAARAALNERLALEAPSRETLALLVTELVTNSVRHAGLRPEDLITVTLSVGEVIAVTVSDPGRGSSRPAIGPGSMKGGWGLQLVDRMTRRWGVAAGHPTRVWFELERQGANLA